MVISRHGTPITTLRGETAKKFMARLRRSDPQQLMARFTGNYKRGNEWGH